jgi:hypothetical protein
VKSFALSRLAQQRLALKEKFIDRFPHDWLIWEPGAWVISRGVVAGDSTVPPIEKVSPRADDPVCFVLEPKPDGTSVSVGRAEGNDLVLSDETVSRNQCFFVHTGKIWAVSCDAKAKTLLLDGERLEAGDVAPMRSRQRLTLGHVVLTLLSGNDLLERLDGK